MNQQSTLPDTQANLHIEIERLRQRLDTRERQLGDLLATIHRDGGQHTVARGYALSVADAIVEVTKLLALKETADE